MTPQQHPKVLVLCTVQTGADAVAEVLRRGFQVEGIVGLNPANADSLSVSGYMDVASFAAKWNIPYYYINSYSLKAEEDREIFRQVDFDLIWVSGWQRLLPEWLISMGTFGAMGGHGSPDGIHGGRGRSPQNWALLLGCKQFDLALFRITPGVDDGPILSQRSFCYDSEDDIAVSYYRASLAISDMVCDILRHPHRLREGIPQPTQAFYYPQRKPEDGMVDWSLSKNDIARHCRALTRPYPGLKTTSKSVEITLWKCQPFDDVIEGDTGVISTCFESGDFLVNCLDGRILIREWEATAGQNWLPQPGVRLTGTSFVSQLESVIKRHKKKNPGLSVTPRLLRFLK